MNYYLLFYYFFHYIILNLFKANHSLDLSLKKSITKKYAFFNSWNISLAFNREIIKHRSNFKNYSINIEITKFYITIFPADV